MTELTEDDLRFLKRYSLSTPWIVDATSLLPQVHRLADMGLIRSADFDHPGFLLTEEGAAALEPPQCSCHNEAGSHELCCGHEDGRSPDCTLHGDGAGSRVFDA